MSYDIESLIYDFDTMLRANLNTEIDAINTEKNDSFAIDPITTNAFAVQSLDDVIDNYKNFVFTMLNEIQTDGIGPRTATTFHILVLIVASGTSNETQSSRRMFRYGRALKQCFENNWASTAQLPIKLKIDQIPPQDYMDMNATQKFKTVGVSISGGFV